MRCLWSCVTALLLGAAVPAMAQQQTKQEIAYLLGAVVRSHCEFNRNGDWHDGEAARAHLQKKYDYLDKRNLAPTTESFIERGASTSSMSGKPYLIRCPGAAPVASATWLKEQLARYRKQGR